MCSILKMSDYVSQNLKTGIHHLPNPQPIFFLKNSKELYHHLDQPSWTKSTTPFSNTDLTCTTNTSFGKNTPQFTPPELAASSHYHHLITTSTWPTVKLSKYADFILKPLLQNIPSHIQDTTDFLKIGKIYTGNIVYLSSNQAMM